MKKHELPEWFPFAIGASLVVVIVAGARSGWTLSGDKPKTPAPPGPQQAGVLQEWGVLL